MLHCLFCIGGQVWNQELLLAERLKLADVVQEPLVVQVYDEDNGRRKREFFDGNDDLMGESRASLANLERRNSFECNVDLAGGSGKRGTLEFKVTFIAEATTLVSEPLPPPGQLPRSQHSALDKREEVAANNTQEGVTY